MSELCRFVLVRWLSVALVATAVLSLARADYDYLSNSLPKAMEGVGIDEKLGSLVPVDGVFRDHRGRQTSIGQVLASEKPVILTLNYSDCPGLCIAQLNGLLRGLNEVTSLKLGTDFHLVSVSIDPNESTAKAAATQAKYSQDLFDQHDAKGWQFWTGSKESIAELTHAVGFRYTFDPASKQYNHSTAAVFIAPSGKITRYLYELGFTGTTFKMATVEAGEGRVGSSMDMVALWCVHYNPMENRYSASARQILSVVAGIFVTVGLMISIPFWLVRKGRKRETIHPVASQSGETMDHDESIRHATTDADRDTMD